jgi:hypothetical protein
MLRIAIGLGVLAGFVLVPAAGRAGPPPLYSLPPYHRVSAYSVWQYYGVDRQGYFRLRVAYQPGYGSFYLYNGKPYPWMTTNSLNVQPFSQGTPYRSYMPYAHD